MMTKRVAILVLGILVSVTSAHEKIFATVDPGSADTKIVLDKKKDSCVRAILEFSGLREISQGELGEKLRGLFLYLDANEIDRQTPAEIRNMFYRIFESKVSFSRLYDLLRIIEKRDPEGWGKNARRIREKLFRPRIGFAQRSSDRVKQWVSHLWQADSRSSPGKQTALVASAIVVAMGLAVALPASYFELSERASQHSTLADFWSAYSRNDLSKLEHGELVDGLSYLLTDSKNSYFLYQDKVMRVDSNGDLEVLNWSENTSSIALVGKNLFAHRQNGIYLWSEKYSQWNRLMEKIDVQTMVSAGRDIVILDDKGKVWIYTVPSADSPLEWGKDDIHFIDTGLTDIAAIFRESNSAQFISAEHFDGSVLAVRGIDYKLIHPADDFRKRYPFKRPAPR